MSRRPIKDAKTILIKLPGEMHQQIIAFVEEDKADSVSSWLRLQLNQIIEKRELKHGYARK